MILTAWQDALGKLLTECVDLVRDVRRSGITIEKSRRQEADPLKLAPTVWHVTIGGPR